MPLLGWLRKSDPLLFVVAALLAAAVLVVYFQDQALRTLRQQRGVILQGIAERHAKAAAESIQRTLEAPIFDTLSAVNHPLLRDGHLDLVAQHYASGLQRFPQIDRFFLWTDQTEVQTPGEVLFFDRAHLQGDPPAVSSFYRDRWLGRTLHGLARQHAASQRIYAAIEDELAGRRVHVLLRLFWVDARRDRYFAVLGYLVDLDAVRSTLFGELYRRELASLIRGAEGAPGFGLQVLDDQERVIFGQQDPTPPLAGRASFPLRFYPGDDIDGRLAVETPQRAWHVQVAPLHDVVTPPLTALLGSYWLAVLPVLLIVIALGFMVQSQRRAAELSRMQATFMSHVSHQLKTPLALLSAACESLTFERVRTPAKLAQYLAIMRSETSRLTTLVERVLEFSRLEQGQRVYDLEVIDLAALVRETADAFNQTLAQEGFDFRVDVPATALWVRADSAALEQVLVNLLDNASKYSTSERAITVRVDTVGMEAYFEVSDRGVGIDAADLPRVFDRFYRGASASLDRRGFGLGLAIAREIVRAHRSRIDVDSRPGRGTTFRVSLPRFGDGREAARAPIGELRTVPPSGSSGDTL